MVSVVIGSWGSYNECNERALGSKWLKLADYECWEDILEELDSEGFELDGIDEELFIQDIDGINSSAAQWEYMNPERLFEVLKLSDVLEDTYQYDLLEAFLEVREFNDFMELVDEHGPRWGDDISLYPDYDWEDYGREMIACMGYNLDESLEAYFDYEEFGKSFQYDSNLEEYSGGLIDIRA